MAQKNMRMVPVEADSISESRLVKFEGNVVRIEAMWSKKNRSSAWNDLHRESEQYVSPALHSCPLVSE
jgi:hypothetical protein